MTSPNLQSLTLSPQDLQTLHDYCEARGFTLALPQNYVLWRFNAPDCVLIAYTSGKLVVQGKGATEFIRYTLETQLPHLAGIADGLHTATNADTQFTAPMAGIDESGKGDFFGPLVASAAYVDEKLAPGLLKMGVRDSKKISDKEILKLSTAIQHHLQTPNFAVVTLGNEAYNRLYDKVQNVNTILAWAHARAIENLLEKNSACTAVLSDQFSHTDIVQKNLMKLGRTLQFAQRPRAESELAVATASILARAEFVRRMEKLSERIGCKLPKGAGPAVLECGRLLWSQNSDVEFFKTFAKTHFKTMQDIQK